MNVSLGDLPGGGCNSAMRSDGLRRMTTLISHHVFEFLGVSASKAIALRRIE